MQATARQRWRIFVLTWLSYGAYYLCRRPFAIAKTTIGDAYHLDIRALGRIDTGYLIAYAFGQFAAGLVADRVGARKLLGFGMLAVAGASVWFGIGNEASVFAVSFAVHGLFQATGWPGVVKAMTAMYRPEERGTVMGWWATCYQVGGIAATALATYLLAHYGWRVAFFVPAAFTAAIGTAILFLLWEPPAASAPQRREASIALARDPLVWALGAAYFCIKLIRYCIIFWLPYFFESALHYPREHANWWSNSFEIGGVVGAILGGWLFDKSGRDRGWLIIGLSVGLALAAIVFPYVAHWGQLWAFGGMVLIGFLLFGPDALVSSVAAQDLGGAAAAGTAAGFINGVGSVGAILQGIVTGEIATRFGWDAMFWVFAILATVAAIAVLPYALAARREPRA